MHTHLAIETDTRPPMAFLPNVLDVFFAEGSHPFFPVGYLAGGIKARPNGSVEWWMYLYDEAIRDHEGVVEDIFEALAVIGRLHQLNADEVRCSETASKILIADEYDEVLRIANDEEYKGILAAAKAAP